MRCGTPNTLRHRKEDGDKQSPKKRLHYRCKIKTNTPGYIARTWAHYNKTIEGPQLSMILYIVGKMYINQSQPNSHTPRTLPQLCQPMARCTTLSLCCVFYASTFIVLVVRLHQVGELIFGLNGNVFSCVRCISMIVLNRSRELYERTHFF